MIHGVINIYKERGFTSHDVVGKLRGILRQKKIGHTGTLDPDAEGVLPVCLGKATKLCDLLTDKEKTYRAVLLLGKTTDTQDVSGTVLSEAPVTAEEEKVREAILSFVGDYDQIPPMYSALKVNGQKLLGCGGCMESLLRTRVERFSLEDAIKLGEVEAIKAEKGLDGLMEKILPIDGMFPDALKAVVPEKGMKALVNGNSLKENQIRPERAAADNERVRVYDEAGRFYALYRYEAAEKQYRLEKMFYDREEEQDGIHTGAGRTLYQR